jgi:hypothetical protein
MKSFFSRKRSKKRLFCFAEDSFGSPILGEADPGGSGGRAPQKPTLLINSSNDILLFPEKEAKSVCSAWQELGRSL